MNSAAQFRFQIFVAENAANSVQAIANLRAICKTHLPERHEIEVINVFEQPQRALAEKILMTPTLVILEPEPKRRLIGNLSETAVVLHAFGIEQVVP